MLLLINTRLIYERGRSTRFGLLFGLACSFAVSGIIIRAICLVVWGLLP